MQKETKQVVARLTVIRKNGLRTIVEVEAGSTFSSFYRFYRQVGAKRSTKERIRTADRNEGCRWIGMQHGQPIGLETIAKRLEFYASQSNPVVSKKIRIFRKLAYQRLLNVSPDQLGLTRMTHLPIYRPVAWRS